MCLGVRPLLGILLPRHTGTDDHLPPDSLSPPYPSLPFLPQDGTLLPPAGCSWLRRCLAAFAAWPRLGALALGGASVLDWHPAADNGGGLRFW